MRKELEQGRSVRYLVPDEALTHIYGHGLYGTLQPPAREGTQLHA